MHEVEIGLFPDDAHSYHMSDEEFARLTAPRRRRGPEE
jgi:hypothetical protein